MITTIIAVLVAWTVGSIIWLYASLGKKYGPDQWYDHLLSPPVLVLSYLIGYASILKSKLNQKGK